MKKLAIFCSVILVLAAPAFSGVVKKTKSDITFRGFGKFTLAQGEKLTAAQKWTDSKSDFKGQGIAGSLAAKTVLRSGDTGEIIDLPAMSVTRLDNKKKEYSVGPIQKLAEGGRGKAQEAQEKPEEQKPEESHIRITKNEFKVEDTGEESTINNFPARKYLVHWLMEWEDTETGEKGSNRLETIVWTTPMSETLQKAQEEEFNFTRSYMEKLGIDIEKLQEDILGTKWLELLDSFSLQKGKARRDFSKAAEEMQKIKGYPVVTDGKYYVTGQKPQGEAGAAEQEEQPKDARGVLGGFAKKMLKKKPAEQAGGADEPALSFYTELVGVSLADLGATDFQVPAGYKKKG